MRFATYLLGFITLALLGVVGTTQAAPTAFNTYGQPGLEAINGAYLTGEIDRAEALLYRAYFVKAPERLPEVFRATEGTLKCGTLILIGAYEELDALGRGDDLRDLRNRPGNLTLTRTSAHFIIHYTNSGGDAAGEAYLDVVEEACEDAWSNYHTIGAWDVPPGDGSNGGGYNMIDCYVHQMSPGILGYAEWETPVLPNPPNNDYTGYFHVGNTINNTSQRKVTVVHEYMHVTQFGYNNGSINSWWMENCAMMGEEWAYDDINDYRGYLSAFFGRPYEPLYTHTNQYEYGQITWPMFHTERFADDLVEDIWDRLQWDYVFWDVIDDALAPYGYDIDEAYVEFMRWCVYTGFRCDNRTYFEESCSWNSYFYTDQHFEAYPTGEQHPTFNPPIDKRPDRVSSSFMGFIPEDGNTDNVLEVTFNGPDCTTAVELFYQRTGQHGHTEYYMTLDENGDGVIEIPGFDEANWVWMLTSMSLYCPGAQDYAFSADTFVGEQDVDEDLNVGNLVRIFPNSPNPVTDRTVLSYALTSSSDVDVHVLDATGRMVRDLHSGEQYPGTYEIIWNRRDNGGREVASGVYYAVVSVDGKELTRQMTVLN